MIFILTGPVHSGKSSLMKRVACELKRLRFQIDGFLSEVVMKDQKIAGYNLFDLKEEKSVPFIRITGEKEWQKIGSFFFIPQGLEKAKRIILRSKEADIGVVDEVGPLELTGKGLWPVLEQVIFPPLTKYLLVVRLDILQDFLKILDRSDVKIFDIQNKNVFPQMLKEIRRV